MQIVSPDLLLFKDLSVSTTMQSTQLDEQTKDQLMDNMHNRDSQRATRTWPADRFFLIDRLVMYSEIASNANNI